MGWARRWRIDSLEKWRATLRALLQFEIDFSAFPCEIIAREERREKSDGQRALFHVVAADLATEVGSTPGEVKVAIKEIYFGDEDAVDRLHSILVGIGEGRYSTEDLDHEHYGELIEVLYTTAAEMGIYIPDRRRR
jgi:hypothetical protein